MKCKIFLVTAILSLSFYLLSQLLNDLETLHNQNEFLHNEIVQLQDRQKMLIESNKAQDKMIAELAIAIHKPQVKIEENAEEVKPEPIHTPTLPMLIGGWEMMKRVLLGSW